MAGLWKKVRGLFKEKDKDGEWQSEAVVVDRSARPRSSGSIAEDQNEFALDLYRRVNHGSENAFFSPFSIRVALAMTFAGASGDTADEMAWVLRIPSPDGAIHNMFAEIIQRLNAADGDDLEMAVANSLWVQEGAPLRTEFVDLVARFYGGGMNMIDFRGNLEDARSAINRWCEDQTKRKIQEIIPQGGLDPFTRLVLTNAVYFKGKWEFPFMELFTSDQPFYLDGWKSVQVPMMRNVFEVPYFSAQGFQVVELDYKGGDLSMLVILPVERDGLQQLEKEMSGRVFNETVEKLRPHDVALHLPKFKMTSPTIELGARLRAIGMPLAFDRERADFSGINGHVPPHEDALSISSVLHKAFVEVNEEGTEAAAVTSASLIGAAGGTLEERKVYEFLADHPFLFAIRDRESGVILFLGRVTNPVLES